MKKNVKSIFELCEIEKIKIIDIGAMSLGEGKEPYAGLVSSGRAEVVGFEPNPTECEKLNRVAKEFGQAQYLPVAVGDGDTKNFYITNTGMTSSIFEPKMDLLSAFQNLAELVQVERIEQINTARLDDLPELGGADYLKIDVQGAEKMVFENGIELLRDIMVIDTEVEFVPLYQNQPLFGDVDACLRENGFLFHKFNGLAGRCFKPLLVNNNPNVPLSQLLWSDVVYVKSFLQLSHPPQKLLKCAAVLHEVYQSFDFCHYILAAYDKATGGNYASRYLREILNVTI